MGCCSCYRSLTIGLYTSVCIMWLLMWNTEQQPPRCGLRMSTGQRKSTSQELEKRRRRRRKTWNARSRWKERKKERTRWNSATEAELCGGGGWCKTEIAQYNSNGDQAAPRFHIGLSPISVADLGDMEKTVGLLMSSLHDLCYHFVVQYLQQCG